jgi:outer membrane receptor protein involved in Fe transport
MIFLCLIFWLTTQPILAQSRAHISGRVIDSSEQQPLAYTTVALHSAVDSALVTGTVTDTDGKFTLIELPAGAYYLLVRFVGFDSKVISPIMLDGRAAFDAGTIVLQQNERLMAEIEVSGKKATSFHTIDRQVFEAGTFQAGQGGSATDLLKNLPSVTVNANGDISVRGSTGFVILINGKPLQGDAQLMLGQIPANAIENIELVTTPSARYDPEGAAGMVNIITKKGAADGLFFQANARLGAPSVETYSNAERHQRYGADFTLNYRHKQWDIAAGANYQRDDIGGLRVGDVYTIAGDTLTRFPSEGERSFDEITCSGRFTVAYTPTPQHHASLGFFAGKHTKDRLADIVYYDNHATYLPTDERLYTMQYFNHNLRIRRGDFVLGSFDYSYYFANKSRISTSFLYEYTMLGGPTVNQNLGWPDTDIVYQDEYNTNDNPLHGYRFQADYTSKPLEIGKLEAGYQYRLLDHTGDFIYERKNLETGMFELVPEFSSSVNLRRSIHSGYGQLSGAKGAWSYSAGLRMELMDRSLELQDKQGLIDTTYLYDFVQFYPSVNLQYELDKGLSIKAGYSRRVERTTTFKMNPFPEREHSETLEQGDPQLLPEFIDLAELGLVKEWDNHSVFATAYFRNVQNLVNRVNTVYNDTILNRIYSNVGRGRSAGIELGAELNPTDWWQIYAGGNFYHYAIDGTFDELPINTSAGQFSINVNTTFALGNTWSLQWSLNYLSERVTAQGEDSRYLSPNLSLKKTFLDDRLTANLQWLNMDMGLWEANEQSIATWREGEFFTTTNYIYEVDVIVLNLSYTLNKSKSKARFIKSEFGEKEF